jgi:hypothetical protein
MNRVEMLEIVDDVIMEHPELRKNESIVYDVVKIILIHYENRLNGKV